MFLGKVATRDTKGQRAMALGKWFSGKPEQKSDFPVIKSDDEWQRELSPEQFAVLRGHGTERPFTSTLNKEQRPGMFRCAGCGLELFRADTKFDSGTGWPSFFAPIEPNVGTSEDHAFLMRRTEVHCARCGGHLGHVFEDGPEPTGLRYCINGVSLSFEASERKSDSPAKSTEMSSDSNR